MYVYIHSMRTYSMYTHTHTQLQIEVMLHYTARASGMYIAMYQCSYATALYLYDTVYVSGNVYKCMTVSNCVYMNMCN